MKRFIEKAVERPLALLTVVIILTAALVVPFLTMAPTSNASTEPDGSVFTARDLIADRFVSTAYPVFFIVESPDGDLLTADSMRELLAGGEAIRTELGSSVFSYFDVTTGTEIVGTITLADLIDQNLPEGLASATDAEVKAVGSAIIDQLGPDAQALQLSVKSTRSDSGEWTVPAFSMLVLGDNNELGFGSAGVNLGTDVAPEEYARDLQAALREATELSVYGVAIDVNLTSADQGQAAGPFIGFTILAVLVIVGFTFRSYWVLAVTGGALAALMIWLKGISNLIGLKDDLVLSLIVPIAMISFGVDFAFHSIGRYREERFEGKAAKPAVIAGMAGVSGALILALTSDIIAFLSNVTAGIESIIQFGLGSAIALAAAYLLLGLVTPVVIAVIEDRIGEAEPTRASATWRWLGSVLAASFAMAAVLVMVFLDAATGVALAGAYVVVMIVVPYLVLARRGFRSGHAPSNSMDRLAAPLGKLLSGMVYARAIVLPVATVVTIGAAYLAFQVPTEFDVEDFFAADTDFVISLNLLDEHVAERGGEPAQAYVEGPFDDPAALAQLATRIDELKQVDSVQYSRQGDGIRVEGGVLNIFETMYASPFAVGAVTQLSGVEITDTDGNNIPDTREQVLAVYEAVAEVGVPVDAERLALSPDDVSRTFWTDGESYATVFALGLVNSRAQEAIVEAGADLAPVLAAISDDFDGSVVELTGGPFVRQSSLDATSRALNVSLPIAVVLCALIAGLFLRSIRYGIVSVVPILMTVAWLYAFMQLAGYAINLVTATIAAVSVGIGIDFAIHYVSRFREELAATGDRIAAVRRAGEGTGTALVASAVSSAIGFGVLAFAPMPLFAAYGLLTAIMIMMALVATLLVLPSILVMITKDTETAAVLGSAG